MKQVSVIPLLFFSALVIVVLSLATSIHALAGTWETKTPMPTGRFGMASGVVNGKIYTAGGFCCVPHTRMTVNEEYDPATDTWTTKPPMPTQRADLSGGSLNGLFYAVGGSGPFCCSSAHEAYDPVTDTWSIRAPMLTPRRALSVASVGGLLHAIGGFIDPGGLRADNEAYDPVTNSWSTKAPMPTGRFHMGLVEINGELYAVGGGNFSGSLSTLEVYDPATDSWTTKTPMPTPRHGPTVGVINNKLYVAGGVQNFAPSPTVDFLDTVEVYDPATDTWSTETPMLTIRAGAAGQVVNDVFYVIGGGDPSTPVNVVEAFSVLQDVKVLPKTGQITSYASGDDGNIQAGADWPTTRFIDHGDGTVTDNLTGLMWVKDASHDGTVLRNWSSALGFVTSMNVGVGTLGYTDWRLPNIHELDSLIDYGATGPALPLGHPFTNIQTTTWGGGCAYWSSTSARPWWTTSPADAMSKAINIGVTCSLSKGIGQHVWAVRGGGGGAIDLPRTGWTTSVASGDDGALKKGIAWPVPRFTDNGDGTVTDNLTGLMWTKDAKLASAPLVWADGLNFIASMNTSVAFGYSDWRMPNIREIRTLQDFSQRDPVLPSGHPFINVPGASVPNLYWSSTTSSSDLSIAATIGLGVLNDVRLAEPKSSLQFVWAVRGGLINRLPIANAGLDQTVHPGTLVTLDGSGSADPDGNVPLSYAWSITGKPAGSTATLTNPTSVFPTFTPDLLGDYTVELVVTDSLGLASQPNQVVVSTFNSAPIANAGPDQAVIVLGTMVQLDGRLSDDENGDPITYFWTISAKPAGSAAVLNDPTLIGPSFVADVQGSYVVTLVVTDSFGAVSAPDTATISFQNVKPVANAGNNQAAVVGDTVFMDGSGSSDANGDPLTYGWSIVSAPVGSTAVLSDPTLAQTTLTPDVPGTYVVGLIVNDGFINSDPDNITITAISVQDQATLLLTQGFDATNLLDNNVFKGKKRKDNLTKKMGQAIEKVAKGEYLEAVEKIDSILNKMDGCATGGAPDSNDKILTCAAQGQVYPLLVQARSYLLTLL